MRSPAFAQSEGRITVDEWRRHIGLFTILMAPALIWLVVFFLLPLAAMFGLSFSEQSGLTETSLTWTFASYVKAFDPIYLSIIGYSIWIAAVTTIVCLVVGYPVAMAVAFAPQRWRPVLLLLVILPFWTNLLVRTYALKSVMGATGLINTVAGFLYGLVSNEPFTPFNMLFNDASVLIGLVYVHLPFMVLPLYTALEKLDRSYLEASLDLGAGQWRTFFSVMMPLTMPAIIAGAIITFIPAFGALVTPALLGAGGSMIGTLIESQFKSANDWPFGSALSLLLVYFTFIILAGQSWLSARHAERQKAKP